MHYTSGAASCLSPGPWSPEKALEGTHFSPFAKR